MATVAQRARAIAMTDDPVLIEGETGVGKSLLAQCIHRWSARGEKRFERRGCGEFDPNLLAAALFGNTKGAFTSADNPREGILVTAQGGTLCLDDIDYLSLPAQAKLLRFLDDRRIYRLGEHQNAIRLDVRIIATTNKHMDHWVARELFLPDLLYRLRQFPLRLPAFRDRPEDVPLLARYFLQKEGERLVALGCRAHVPVFTDEALTLLGSLDWPGNARQLRSAVKNLALFAGAGAVITQHETITNLFDREHGFFMTGENHRVGPTDDSWLYRVLVITGGNVLATSRVTGLSRTTIYKKIEENRWSLGRRQLR